MIIYFLILTIMFDLVVLYYATKTFDLVEDIKNNLGINKDV